MWHKGETRRPRQRLGETTQIDGLAARRAAVLVLDEEHLRPAYRAVVADAVHRVVDAHALDAVHCIAVDRALDPAKIGRHRKEERREQTKFSRNEDVETGKRQDQIGPHQK